MANKMLVETDPHQTRIAVLEEDRPTEILVERHRHHGLVGNVYKGRVNRVLPGMQAAFVDIGLERDAFLYVSDVAENVALLEENEGAAMEEDAGGAAEAQALPAAPQIPPQTSIDELLRVGQELLVQVIKDPLPSKGARVIDPRHAAGALPGPAADGSPLRRFTQDRGRGRARAPARRLGAARPRPGRPRRSHRAHRRAKAARARSSSADRRYLLRLWERLRERAERSGAPTLLHQELDLALRAVRDLFSPALLGAVGRRRGRPTSASSSFSTRCSRSWRTACAFSARMPRCSSASASSARSRRRSKPKVWLKSGGYLVINPTEALVAIDVNTGRFVGQRNLEDTVLRTNLEAVAGDRAPDPAARSGRHHRHRLHRHGRATRTASACSPRSKRELRKDRAKNKVLNISEFGLVEITRKRSRTNLERLLTQPCPYCSGKRPYRLDRDHLPEPAPRGA